MLRRRSDRVSTYGGSRPGCHPKPGRRWLLVAVLTACLAPADASAKTLKLVAFGDSLMAGYGLPAGADFPARLEAALRQDGIAVDIANASVSGDTTSGGLDRLDWSVPDGTDGVLLELGANDMLRGLDPSTAKSNLEEIIGKLSGRHIATYLLGMKASPTLGADYVGRFDALYPAIASAEHLPLTPFVLDGVAAHAQLQLADGMHPNAAGIAVMVERIKPGVEDWLKTLQQQP